MAQKAPKEALECAAPVPLQASSVTVLHALHMCAAHEPLTGLLCCTCTRPRPFSSLSLCSWCSRDSACSWASTSFCLSKAAGAQGQSSVSGQENHCELAEQHFRAH